MIRGTDWNKEWTVPGRIGCVLVIALWYFVTFWAVVKFFN
jgi:hypothetical protein